MRKSSLLILFVLPLIVSSQNKYLDYESSFRDSKIVKQYRDSLNQKFIDTVIVYMTKEEEQEVTYLIWILQNEMDFIKVTDTCIYTSSRYYSQTFSKKLKPYEVAILKYEDQLKFVPPFNFNAIEVIIFYLKGQSYLVERGDVRNYVLDKRRTKKREELFNNLKKDLYHLKNGLIHSFSYDRPL
ncbi:MAG: hypothetical protein JST29_12075 [Bacteroidetes bacterium]|nr:hypothetical protein [Bacteroidota bacterium]